MLISFVAAVAAAAKRYASVLAYMGGCLIGAPVLAASLQVSPVTIDLQARQNSEGLWLSNSGTQPLQAQVRVYAWVQEGGEDLLKLTNDMVASPPMLTIQPGQRQIVRLVRVGAGQAPPSTEKAYRVVMDELPVGAGAEGVKFVLRYSVPIFIAPPAPEGAAGGQSTSVPAVVWSVREGPGGAVLTATNKGSTRAKVTNVSLLGRNGKKIVVSEGLYGYVLPGSIRHWSLSREAGAAAHGGKLDLTVNDQALSVQLQTGP